MGFFFFFFGVYFAAASFIENIFFGLKTCLLKLQTPKATVEVKELKVDIFKDSGSGQNLFVKLHILPIVVHMGEHRVSIDQSSNFISEGCLSAGQSTCAIMERASAPFFCEEFSLSCEFGHDRYFLSALILAFIWIQI